jgi:hypothetical protein
MCGILYAKRRDKVPANKSLMKRFKRQKTRGLRGFGFVSVRNGKVIDVRRFETEAEMEKAVDACDGTDILFHHRLPTSTPNLEDMAHPIEVDNKELEYKYYVIHNGVLQNERTLKAKHELLGYVYTTLMKEIKVTETRNGRTEDVTEKFNDSEALAIEAARFLDGKSDKIDIVGSAAIIVYKVRREDNEVISLHWGRNEGNPMVREDNNDLFFLKSEGDGTAVPEDILFSMDYQTEEITERPVPIGRRTFQTYNGGSSYDSDDWLRSGRAGFGNHGQKVRSPLQRKDLLGEGGWGEEEDEDDIRNVIRFDADDTDYDSLFREHQKTPEYLDELLEEIRVLERDIADCESAIASGQTTFPGAKYSEDYLEEAVVTLADKRLEANDLRKYLYNGGLLD